MNVLCVSNLKLLLIFISHFTVILVGAMAILHSASKYGRRPISALCDLVAGVGLISIYYTTDISTLYLLLTISSMFILAKGCLLYRYMLELVPNRLKLCTNIMSTLSSVLTCIFVITMTEANSTDAMRLMPLLFGILSLTHLLIIYRLPESPFFLYKNLNFVRLHETLVYIAEVNKCPKWNLLFSEEVYPTHKTKSSESTAKIHRNAGDKTTSKSVLAVFSSQEFQQNLTSLSLQLTAF